MCIDLADKGEMHLVFSIWDAIKSKGIRRFDENLFTCKPYKIHSICTRAVLSAFWDSLRVFIFGPKGDHNGDHVPPLHDAHAPVCVPNLDHKHFDSMCFLLSGCFTWYLWQESGHHRCLRAWHPNTLVLWLHEVESTSPGTLAICWYVKPKSDGTSRKSFIVVIGIWGWNIDQ